MRTLDILHVGPLSGNRITGLNVSIPNLAYAQSMSSGVSVRILNSKSAPPPASSLPVGTWRSEVGPIGALRNPRTPDLVVFHSTYLPRHALLGRWLQQRRIPYIITPRGGLTREALQRKRLKKAVGDRLFFHRLVSGAIGIHFLSNAEAESSRTWNLPYFVQGNGTSLPTDAEVNVHQRVDSSPLVLFIGRLDVHMKGLDLLLQAWALSAPKLKEKKARLIIRGPGNSAQIEKLHNLIRILDISDQVEIGGAVTGTSKADLLSKASLFVHTSRSEGQPSAILEAMAYGIPCLVTPGTNMADEVRDARSGWAVASSPVAIAEAIVQSLGSRMELVSRGMSARERAVEQFSWATVAERTLAGYRDLMNNTSRRGWASPVPHSPM